MRLKASHPGGPKNKLTSPLSVADRARHEAERLRSTVLMRISEGSMSVLDAVLLCDEPGFEPLRRMRLRSALMAQPDWGERKADRLIARLTQHSRLKQPRSVRLWWVLQSDSVEHLSELLSPERPKLHPRFPFFRAVSTAT